MRIMKSFDVDIYLNINVGKKKTLSDFEVDQRQKAKYLGFDKDLKYNSQKKTHPNCEKKTYQFQLLREF